MSAVGTVDLGSFGVAVGPATDAANATGLTVVRGVAGPLRAGMAVLGRATGTRGAGPALEKAIERAVRLARGRDGIPDLADGPPAM